MNATTKTEPALEAFAGQDSSVFLAWAEAVADLVACSDAKQAAQKTMPNIGGLIYALVQAAQELGDAERAAQRAQP